MKFLYMFGILSTCLMTEKPDPIYYISLNKAVHMGYYYPTADVGELLQHGDFGIGSEQELATELVILDGKVYGFSANGSAEILKKDDKLAFAATKFFDPEKEITINREMNFAQLQKLLDSVIVYNAFAAIRVDAKFSHIQYQCYAKQEWPYKPTKHATLVQFDQKNVEGTLVGFHTPHPAIALNSPDYHFHFINSGRTHGGHLNKCKVESVTIQVDYADRLEVHLPDLRRVNIDKKMRIKH